MKITLLLSLLITIKICQSANILAILPVPVKSHMILFQRLFKELALRGHNIDVVSHFPLDKPPARYKDLSIKGSVPVLDNVPIKVAEDKNVIERISIVLKYVTSNLCGVVLNTEVARNLKNSTKKYDLLIVHILGTYCTLGFAHLFEIPSMAVVTSVNLPWTSSFIGLPDNPSYVPTIFSPYSANMTLWERFMNTFVYISSHIMYRLYTTESNAITKKFFGPNLPDLDDLASNLSLIMANSHFTLHQSRPVLPNFIEISGIHINNNITLPRYFEEALKTSLKGVIFLSFGTVISSATISEEKLQIFFDVFRSIPYKILWKANKEDIPGHLKIPDNIQFERWLPQLGILCHPNVKLFISHGGLLGSLEALHCGVPVLGIPIIIDQFWNIQNSVSKGIALEVPFADITKDKLNSTITLLLDDPKYKANVERLSELFQDRPNSALETTIYWVEYIIRHRGAPHLRSIAANLPWYKYYLVDVIGVTTFIIFLIIYIFYKVCIAIYFKLRALIKQYCSKMKMQ